MPTHDFNTIGDVLDFEILKGKITAIDSAADTCTVTVAGSSREALIFYHCKPDSIIRDNGAIEGGAGGFKADDEVIVMINSDNSVVKVIGHIDGIRNCSRRFILIVYGSQWLIWDVEGNKPCDLTYKNEEGNEQSVIFPCDNVANSGIASALWEDIVSKNNSVGSPESLFEGSVNPTSNSSFLGGRACGSDGYGTPLNSCNLLPGGDGEATHTHEGEDPHVWDIGTVIWSRDTYHNPSYSMPYSDSALLSWQAHNPTLMCDFGVRTQYDSVQFGEEIFGGDCKESGNWSWTGGSNQTHDFTWFIDGLEIASLKGIINNVIIETCRYETYSYENSNNFDQGKQEYSYQAYFGKDIFLHLVVLQYNIKNSHGVASYSWEGDFPGKLDVTTRERLRYLIVKLDTNPITVPYVVGSAPEHAGLKEIIQQMLDAETQKWDEYTAEHTPTVTGRTYPEISGFTVSFTGCDKFVLP
jgi:hypothetical protein